MIKSISAKSIYKMAIIMYFKSNCLNYYPDYFPDHNLITTRMSNPRTPGCDSEENEFAKQGGITNGAAWSVFSSIFILLFNDFFNS